MKKTALVIALTLSLGGCGKVGAGGFINQAVGNWAEVSVPEGCVPEQIAAEHSNGVAVLCKDGRVFH